MLISAFITHKKAEHFSDCQDRFSINADTKSIALSDGMSQSIFQKYWAEILVDKFTSNSDWVPNLESVKELAPIWKAKVLNVIQQQKENGNRSAWRAERNLIDGLSAGATFLGIRFSGNQWECEVLGDSCLILIHDNQITEIISSEEVNIFDSYPDYYDSNPIKAGKGVLRSYSGTFESGDTILLVSDPFSDFLLKKKSSDEEPILINQLLGINSHREFEEVVENWRTSGMHNDDSTLIIIKKGAGDSFNITCEDNIDSLIEQEKVNYENSQNVVRENSEPILCKEKNLSKKNNEIKVIPVVQNLIDLNTYFNDCFYKNIESIIHKRLGKWTLTQEKKKQKVQIIVDEIKNLITYTIKK